MYLSSVEVRMERIAWQTHGTEPTTRVGRVRGLQSGPTSFEIVVGAVFNAEWTGPQRSFEHAG